MRIDKTEAAEARAHALRRVVIATAQGDAGSADAWAADAADLGASLLDLRRARREGRGARALELYPAGVDRAAAIEIRGNGGHLARRAGRLR